MEEDCGLFFVQEFIKGMLNKELTWFPQKGMEVETGLVTLEVPCWRCKKTTQVVAGLEVKNQTKTFKKFYDFKEVSETILSMISPNLQEKYKIGIIKKRYSKTMQQQYLSNGCYYCDAIYGNFFLREEILELLVVHADLHPIITNIHHLGNEIPLPYQSWYFQGKRGVYNI